jgi:putative Mn2+ efflux pump MntP
VLWLYAVLIAAVSNLDNLAVGVASGLRARRIAAAPNLIIAVVTMVGTAVAMVFGRALSRLMSLGLASVLGSLIIMAIGGATVVASLHALRDPTSVPKIVQRRRAGAANETVSWREALLLGVALSLNNVGAGVGAGVAGVPPLATTALAGVFSVLCVGGGSKLGSSVVRVVAVERAQLIGGLVLVAVGAVTLLGVR